MKFCPMCKIEKSIDDFYNDKSRKDGKDRICKSCSRQNTNRYQKNNPEKMRENSKKYKQQTKKNAPWRITFSDIKQRCNNPNNTRHDEYGGRGIKCLITKEELKDLWFRDKAWRLTKASIDRIDNNGNYTYDNCQFIEMIENSTKDKCKVILQYDLDSNLIKEFPSTIETERQTGFSHKVIGRVALGQRKTAYGYIWKYKENNNAK